MSVHFGVYVYEEESYGFMSHFVAGRGAAGDVGEVKLRDAPPGVISTPQSIGPSGEMMGRGSR